MIHRPGIVLDATTASAANEAYQQIAKFDKLIASVIENASTASIWIRDKGNNPVGWDGIVIGSSLGQEIKSLILKQLYERRAPFQRKLAQLGYSCSDAPK